MEKNLKKLVERKREEHSKYSYKTKQKLRIIFVSEIRLKLTYIKEEK